MSNMVDQVIQVAGAALILAAFVTVQTGWFHQKSPAYLVANMLGSGGLAIAAIAGRQWGFLLLEGSWSLISLAALVIVAVRAWRARLARPGGLALGARAELGAQAERQALAGQQAP